MTAAMCPGCQKPEPRYYCWEGRDVDCPMRYPPRWVTDAAPGVLGLWGMLRDLHDRIEKLASATESEA